MLKHFKFIILLFLGFIFTDCATHKSGTSQEVVILSNPPGANVYIDNLHRGVTPLTANLGKNNNYKVLIEKLGYDKHLAFISSTVTPISFGGIMADVLLAMAGVLMSRDPNNPGPTKDPVLRVMGPALIVVPISVDLFSGAYKILTPEIINITLQKSEATPEK